MYSISREYAFCAAHRLEGHPKCGRLHGHNYVVTIALEGEPDSRGMILDYADLDKTVKPLIEAMDHRSLVSVSNYTAGDLYAAAAIYKGQAYVLWVEASTAECLAKMLALAVREGLTEHRPEATVTTVIVTVQETPKSKATYREEVSK